MLSKSAARLFFVAGTTIFSLVFLALTVDTIAKVPERSNQDQMTEAVKRGHTIWTDNNCMGCHTLLGEGAYYAPELTKVVERRGKPWMRVFLKDPQAMYPGKRKMVNYNFKDEEIEDLITFFDWVGQIDANGFPPEPDLAVKTNAPSTNTQANVRIAEIKAPEIFTTICVSCHAVAGKGGNVGPALDGVGHRYTEAELDRWLADPQAVKPGTAMPNLNLDDQTRAALVAYLTQLQ